jgi:hypothetical protein
MYRLRENTRVIQPGKFFGDEVLIFAGLISDEQAIWIKDSYPERAAALLEEVK